MEISGKAKVLGVLGHPIGHSLSPAMHNAAIAALGLDYVYVPFDVDPKDLGRAMDGIRALGVVGVNVTIPHKEAVIAFLDEVDENAREIGSVNTVANVDGRLVGSSTDGPGFMRSLDESGYVAAGSKVVLLGGGGAGRAVAFALAKSGAEVVIYDEASGKADRLAREIREVTGAVSTCGKEDFEEVASFLESADLLVNSTPVGMHPKVDGIPLSPKLLRPGMMVYDVVYNPMRTRLLREAESIGAQTVSGMKMFIYQGAISFKKWTGIDPPADNMEDAVLKCL